MTGYDKTVSIDITEIEIPEGVKVIGEGAFTGFTKVTSVILPNTLKKIDSAAFEGCVSLIEITIPASVTELGDMIFNNCEQQMTVYFEGTEEQWLAIIKDDELWSYDNDIILKFVVR